MAVGLQRKAATAAAATAVGVQRRQQQRWQQGQLWQRQYRALGKRLLHVGMMYEALGQLSARCMQLHKLSVLPVLLPAMLPAMLLYRQS
jgi:hypothetical protein